MGFTVERIIVIEFDEKSIAELKEIFEAYNLPKDEPTVSAWILGYAAEDDLANWKKVKRDNMVAQSNLNLSIMAEELLKRIKE